MKIYKREEYDIPNDIADFMDKEDYVEEEPEDFVDDENLSYDSNEGDIVDFVVDDEGDVPEDGEISVYNTEDEEIIGTDFPEELPIDYSSETMPDDDSMVDDDYSDDLDSEYPEDDYIEIEEPTEFYYENEKIILEKGDRIKVLKERDMTITLEQGEIGVVLEALDWFKNSPSAKQYYSPRFIDDLADKILKSRR